MADGVKPSNRNTDGVSHPFAIDNDDQPTCSAFRVVPKVPKKSQKSEIDDKYAGDEDDTRRKANKPDNRKRKDKKDDKMLFEHTQNAMEGVVPYNHEFGASLHPCDRFNGDPSRTSLPTQPKVGFVENPTARTIARGELRGDAIGPGVFLDKPSIHVESPWPEQPFFVHENARGDNQDGQLRNRGRRNDASSNYPRSGVHPASNYPNPDCNSGRINKNSNNSAAALSGRKNVFASRHRLTNDLELLSRPSWCDAKFAYDQVLAGKALGNKSALWFRSILHRLLFCLGCFIQRRATFVLIPCLMVLAACAIGLKQSSLETRVEKLWVEAGGILEGELEYTANSVGDVMDTSSLLLIQVGDDTASVASLQLHLKAALAASKVTVTAYEQDWEMSDLCYKEVPTLGETAPTIEQVVEKVFPCLIMGPLDCFYEGAELLGPSTPYALPSYKGIKIPPFTWKTLDPLELVELFSGAVTEAETFSELISSAGIGHGYQDRWCLDPYDPECPDDAPNKRTKEIPNVKELLSKGCEGYATKYMKWPNDLILGGVEKDENGNITRVQGLQTLIHLMGVTTMYNFHKNNVKVNNWSWEKAKNIITLWQRKFVQEMYKVIVNGSSFDGNPDEIHAFAPSTSEDLLLEFSNFSIIRVAMGYLLMVVYACLTMLRCKASRSQGAIGMVGVILVALSVMAGLGICSVLQIKFNAATTQVLPFLMLGLGVDDMFLIAHQFGEIACLNYIAFEERTGECLKRVGVSVLLTSLAILSGFLFSMIIPMPALRSFALQAAIVTCFNLFCVLVVFPAVLSLDLQRRKKNKLDIFCCFQSSSANDVVEISDYGHEISPPRVHSPPIARFTALPAGPHPSYMEPEATVTMHHTVQAFSNDSFVTFVGPTAETTYGPNTIPATLIPGRPSNPHLQHPLTPPPRYTPDGIPVGSITPEPPLVPRPAFQEPSPEKSSNQNYSSSSQGRKRIIQTHSSMTPVPKTTSRTPRTTTSNLVTPMESVRSSTHSLVPAARSRASKWFCWSRNKSQRNSEYSQRFQLLTLSAFAKKYYAPFLMKKSVKATVLTICCLLLGGSIYGCFIVRDGLDLVDIVPRDTREHAALSAQLKYFSFYNMHLVTKEFDYAHKQKELHMLHHNITELKYVVRNTDGTKTKFWLERMRDWLQGLMDAFDSDWNLGHINETTWKPQASDEGKLAFTLLLQTGKLENTIDRGRIGCAPPNSKPCNRVNIVRLVSDDGIIREDAFYNYLTAWTQHDPLAYMASQATIVPTPLTWDSERAGNFIVTRSKGITYAQMLYYLNGLKENDDFVEVIKAVRSLCDHYEAQGLLAYPSGYPFLFWQQYIDLRQWLFVAIGAAIVAISAVVSLILLNLWAGGITCLFLIIITTELLGFMGIAGIKLSAVPAVILISAIGLGVEFTVHITLAFVTSCGSREDRTQAAVSHMMGPVIDGAISTFLGVVMLSGSEFDFIIRYFFLVLAVLVLIGLWNGIVVLPVVLSFIGPKPEVEPRGGGSRLKTPTPPPTPPMVEEDNICPNCNNSSNGRFSRFRNDGYGRYSSRDDLSYMPRPYTGEIPYNRGPTGPYYPPTPHRYSHHIPHLLDPRIPCQVNHGYSHPHSTGNSGSSTPRAPMGDGRVFICQPDVVLYTSRQRDDTHTQHCDSSLRGSPMEGFNSRRRPDRRLDEGDTTAASSNSRHLGKPIATVTSSFTLKVLHPRHQHIPVHLPPSSNIGDYSSTDSSTMDMKFQPIPESQHIGTRLVPSYSETVRNDPIYSGSYKNGNQVSQGAGISPNVDQASEAVDSAFSKLGSHGASG